MPKIIKILFISILFTFIIAIQCYAINESELYGNTLNNSSSNDNNLSYSENDYTIGTNDNIDNSNSEHESIDTSTTYVAENTTQQNSSPVTTTSTRVSSVSSVSNNSTFANILCIALIVVGILLIFLAIAILIRLHQ